MKIGKWLRAAVIATASCLTIAGFSPATASVFEKKEVDQTKFIAIAIEYEDGDHKMIIVEQVSREQRCWAENNTQSLNNQDLPVLVDPLLMTFDFTGVCRRSTDSNGYSIRMNDQDLGSDYLLTLVKRGQEFVLVGVPRPWAGRGLRRIEIGRTRGDENGHEKIALDPGWRFTKRTYQGRELGHVYLTYDSAEGITRERNTTPKPLPPANEPERELIFEPEADAVDPFIEEPETINQIPAAPSNSESTVPVLVVPVR
ncbi:MAG: DUF3747 domain-containing protein [Symploca sp. SIO2C1]|nr:DUF3747 domain-containing protein [Symploca sp. SIO2C1]